MARKTNKEALKNVLQDLSKDKFSEICHRLRDRNGKPRVSYSDVEDKNVLQITDLMVSFFTESKVLQVARTILRQINCNQEARTLSLKIKASVDKGKPTIHKNCAAGGKGLKAKKILQRDKEQPAATNTSAVPKAAKKEPLQNKRGQPTSASTSEVGPKQKKAKKAKMTDEEGKNIKTNNNNNNNNNKKEKQIGKKRKNKQINNNRKKPNQST
ncbi:putative uncharacterized protein DDB_G0292292 [Sander lucioperca]|uniref:putative uncharacterized protein DDB_G0292292 n=1 Tax=Sander lucioperca TaxID=283035 RepID=UPI00125E04D4|nr:putative uncharacterized protein DDB_G0292292 [Sander lucioperca]